MIYVFVFSGTVYEGGFHWFWIFREDDIQFSIMINIVVFSGTVYGGMG